MTQTDRRPGLDVVRSAAILFVMVHHLARYVPGAPAWVDWTALRGFVGVDLFFVLSGWLIGGQLVRELRATGSVDLGRFWVKRWFRTLPAYYAVLALVAAQGHATAGELASMVVFAQNYLAPHAWMVTWSLCIEEHFYLVLPLLVLVARRLPRAAGWALIVAALAVSPVLRWVGYGAMAAGSYRDFLGSFYGPTHLRLEGLALGVAAAALAQYFPAIWAALERRGALLCAAGAALVLGSVWNPWLTGWTGGGEERMAFFPAVVGFLLVSVGTAFTLPLASCPVARLGFAWAPFVWIAEHAYALYLTHELMPGIVNRVVPRSLGYWPRVAICFVAAFVVAAVLRRLIEVPGLALRDRLLRRATPSSALST